jgi:uncharacterized membrane protein
VFNLSRSLAAGVLLAAGVAGGLFIRTQLPPVHAAEPDAAEAAKIDRAREQVKMLDDLYKNAVVAITSKYVENQADTPAAAVAKEVFAAMHKKGWHTARLVDVTGRPKNKENVAKTDFEKKAVQEIKSGKTYYEEIGEKDGKPVFRAATVVPAVMQQCVVCHGKRDKNLLGTIVYELPIK